MPQKGYWEDMQAVLRRCGITFLVDEVVCGIGQSSNLRGSGNWGLKPAMMSCATALSAALFPNSALMFKDEMYAELMRNSDEVGTSGHGYAHADRPVGAAVSLVALDICNAIDLAGHVRKASETFLARCKEMIDHPPVGDLRGAGLFCGCELMNDAKAREPLDPSWKVGELVQKFAHDCGLYLRASGDRIGFMPPMIDSEGRIEIATGRFRGALDDAWTVVRVRV